ncbi:MAG: AraC family transcriptional regulator [Alteromonadaceae bacterium]|nr:AraC family transcriptional regulator [Alteromonadaceae bacterium]
MINSSNKQFENILHYINEHLEQNLTIELLCDISFYSKYHFHRQFSAFLGISVAKYIQLQRLKKAAYQLSFRKQIVITEIGFNAGFQNSESFSRAFKNVFVQTPSQFRKNPNWQHWQTLEHQLNQRLNNRVDKMINTTPSPQVKIVDFPETKIAVLEHRGSPNDILTSVGKFITWRKQNKLSPKVNKTFNLLYDDVEVTADKDYRFDICVEIKDDVSENDFGIVTKKIPQGRCAVLRHMGNDSTIEKYVNYLYNQWLTESDVNLRDFPCFLHRVTLFPDVKEHEMITDIYLPIE